MSLSLERTNVLLLAGAQALFQTTSVLMVTIAGLVGRGLAPHQGLATLPVAIMMVGAAVAMIPASLLMQRVGRRNGFLAGTGFGVMAGALAVVAVSRHDFVLFVLANALVGVYQGFAQYYRFAASEAASDEFRSRAISWVIAGGVFAAIAGPNIARFSQAWSVVPFLWAFVAVVVLGLVAAGLVSALDLPTPTAAHQAEPARPLAEIVRQPAYLTALATSAVGYGVMIMVMTATPLAMQMCGLAVSDATTVIQWHVLGMFVPSFFTGDLIRRFGVLRVTTTGALLLLAHVLVSLSANGFSNFVVGLVLVGIGWNFLFIGGTTMLAQTYRPSERAKAQGTHDFLVFGALTAASFSAGGVLNAGGWSAVNLLVLPLLAFALLMIGGQAWRTRTARLSSA